VGQLVPATLLKEAPPPGVVKSLVTIAGGKEVRPITKMSRSDWAVAGSPSGGRKKEAGTATSSPPGISRHWLVAQFAASDGHASVPTKRQAQPGSSSVPVESPRSAIDERRPTVRVEHVAGHRPEARSIVPASLRSGT
jgi:hypothetical protein